MTTDTDNLASMRNLFAKAAHCQLPCTCLGISNPPPQDSYCCASLAAKALELAALSSPPAQSNSKMREALEQISDPLMVKVTGVGWERALNIISEMQRIARDALASSQADQGHERDVPDGWQLVPKDRIVIQRWWLENVLSSLDGHLPPGRIGDSVFLLRAMIGDLLAAAPNPTRTEEG